MLLTPKSFAMIPRYRNECKQGTADKIVPKDGLQKYPYIGALL